MHSLSFITLSKNEDVAREIRQALPSISQANVLATCHDYDTLLADAIRLRPSAAIIVIETDAPEKAFALIRKLNEAVPETAIITAAKDASPAIILGSMRAGTREFLQLPVVDDELHTVLRRVAEFSATVQNRAHPQARVVGVFSTKGGVGVSFLSTNLAAAMSVSTLLVDLNLQSGDAASFLGLSPKYSLADFAINRHRLDESLINSLITNHSATLSLLAAPLEAHEAEEISTHDVAEVLHLLGRRHQCIVMDLPHTFDPITVGALDLADEILVLMTLDIPGIRSTKRALKVFERLGYPHEKVRVVVNRWSKSIDVELQKVETHLNERLVGFVPNDYRKVMESINLGRPVVHTDPGSKLTVEIKRIAQLVSGSNYTTPSQPRKRLWGSVFGRQRVTRRLEITALDPA